MANSDPLYRSQIVTSIHGARLGLAKDGTLVGPVDIKVGITTPTTGGSASPLPAHGITLLSATAPTTAYMDAPIPGIYKTIILTGTGTSQAVVLNGGNFVTSLGSSFTRIQFNTTGDSIGLVGITTALMAVVGPFSTAGGMSMTTTT